VAEIRAAALHERFGETRPMPQHRIVSNAALPWTGGWWIAPRARPDAVVALEVTTDRISVRLTHPQFALTWRPHSTEAVDAVSFCSAEGGSAN
jgi:hypothetical protein